MVRMLPSIRKDKSEKSQVPPKGEYMLIQKIRVTNFKTFRGMEITLDGLSVIIGTNAAGKSNFIGILRFIRDIAENGLENAIALQGGREFIQNIHVTVPAPLSMEFQIDFGQEPVTLTFCEDRSQTIEATVRSCTYRVSLSFDERRPAISEEEIRAAAEFLSCSPDHTGCSLGKGTIMLRRNPDGTPHTEISPASIQSKIQFGTVIPRPLPPHHAILEQPVFFPPLSPLTFQVAHLFRSISIFDLDPALAKRASMVTGMSSLSADGGNLPITLKHILEDPAAKRRMLLLLAELLPFVEDISVEYLGDRSLVTSMRETYAPQVSLPAPFLSDGTIQMIAIIVALYFEERSPLIFEEPGRNIHPYLISKVIDMMKDVAGKGLRQIILTTHNPEIVKYAGVEHIILLRRDEEGYSLLSRPQEHHEIRAFLETMGIEELYTQNLLS